MDGEIGAGGWIIMGLAAACAIALLVGLRVWLRERQRWKALGGRQQ